MPPVLAQPVRAFHVPARQARVLPELGSDEPVPIAAAPAAPESQRGWLAAVVPGLSALGMLGFALLSPNVVIIALIGGVALLSAVAGVWAARHQRLRRDQVWIARRARYLGHLSCQVTLLADAASRQRAYALAAHPPPATAAAAPEAGLLWQVRPGDEDYLRLRVGTGRATARRPAQLAGTGADPDGDTELLAAAADVVVRHGAVDGLPVTIGLDPGAIIALEGDQLPLLRALIVALVRSHGPDSVRLHAAVPAAEQAWLAQLPHAVSVGSDVETMLRGAHSPGTAHHVVILAVGGNPTDQALRSLTPRLPSESRPAMTILMLVAPGAPAPPEADLVLSTDADGGLMIATSGRFPRRISVARPDSMSYAEASRFAKALTTWAVAEPGAGADSPLRLRDLLSPPGPHPLALPFALGEGSDRVLLDLRESARGGDGPHGLIIGATGSGKSELLRTLLIAAAHQSPPEELAFLLVDYKGGAAFSELGRLPHTAGLLTNLTADPQAVDRFCASLRAELRRRQSALLAAGVDDVDRYQGRYANSRARQAMHGHLPRLLVVIDEYAELIEQSPEALDVLTSLGRVGRSLGIHLLLSSQRLDDGRLRGLDAHLRYRICLRTYSTAESIAVIGSPVAAQLPSTPGLGWLSRDGDLHEVRIAVVGDSAAAVDGVLAALGSPGTARRARPVLLPPLPEVLSLDLAQTPLGCVGGTATVAPTSGIGESVTAPVGLLDLPELGEQRPLIVDPFGTSGHLAIVGAPRSGRSTALTSVTVGLALATSPRDLSIHVVAPATSLLCGIAGLPHVGTVATTRELQARVIRAVAAEVLTRQTTAAAPTCRLMLVIDGLADVVGFGDDALLAELSKIASIGLSVGVCLAVSSGRWLELRGGLREAIGTRWELRLNDGGDSLYPQLTRGLQRRPAGRVLTDDGAWAQISLPRLHGSGSADQPPESVGNLGAESLGEQVAESLGDMGAESLGDMVATIARKGGPPTRPIQLLPLVVSANCLPAPSRAGRVPIGLSGVYAEPVEIGIGPGEHLLILGNRGSGRSGLLRAVGATMSAAGARMWIVDPRSRLGHMGSCLVASSPAEMTELMARLSTELVERHETTGRQRPAATDVLLIDDLDLAAGPGGSNPFGSIAELLPFAVDLGLSIVASRRVSGSSRASFDPFFGRLLEFADSTVLLSGDPAEGPVTAGLRPRPEAPGRGRLVLGGEFADELQVAWLPSAVVDQDGQLCPRADTANAHQADCEPKTAL